MPRIFNPIGSLTALKSELAAHRIHDFNSVKEVMDFQKNYPMLRMQVISEHEMRIELEKKELNAVVPQLEVEVANQKREAEERLTTEIEKIIAQINELNTKGSANFFKKIRINYKKWNCSRKLKNKTNNFETEVVKSIQKIVEQHQLKYHRLKYITSQFKAAVEESAHTVLAEMDRKKSVIDKLNSIIYGAVGEQKVVRTLEVLSNDYFLINDFAVSFYPAIYNRQDRDYVKSIQIDHILVAPSGIFLIETKNWSNDSLENLNLFSPIQQIKRTSFVLFNLLNNKISGVNFRLDSHHWGSKKVSIKNLLVFINNKPLGEFEFVKVLTLNELLGYINYFKPIFSNEETKRIADFLLSVNEQKKIRTK